MSGQRFEGKHLEEAIENAAEALGVDRFRVSYHVVLEKRGFLGGTRRVVIEAEIADAPAADEPAPRSASREPRVDRERSRRGPGQGSGRSGRGRGRGESREGEAPRFVTTMPPELREQAFEHAPEQEPESPEAVRVHEWVQRVIELSGLDVEVRTKEEPEALHLNFYGPSSSDLLDRDGELLDSLQVLATKALGGRSIEKVFEFDCGGFKQQRRAQLGQLARELADRVRGGHGEQLLPAMSPVERRIVHLALEEDGEVTTESRGDGFFKRVAIVERRTSTSG